MTNGTDKDVMANLSAWVSPCVSVKAPLNHPTHVGPPPNAMRLRMKKNKAVDMALILIGARV